MNPQLTMSPEFYCFTFNVLMHYVSPPDKVRVPEHVRDVLVALHNENNA